MNKIIKLIALIIIANLLIGCVGYHERYPSYYGAYPTYRMDILSTPSPFYYHSYRERSFGGHHHYRYFCR